MSDPWRFDDVDRVRQANREGDRRRRALWAQVVAALGPEPRRLSGSSLSRGERLLERIVNALAWWRR